MDYQLVLKQDWVTRMLDEWLDWLGHVLKQDIANLSIHLRTKKEMSKVDAHWELIPEIKKLRDEIAPNTLLTINGDIPDRATGLKLVEQYGVDGVMIGRGVFTNPFAFEIEPKEHSVKEFLNLLLLHLDLHDKYSTEIEPRPFKQLHRFFKIYIRGFSGAGELRNQLMNTNSTDEVRRLVQPILVRIRLSQARDTEIGSASHKINLSFSRKKKRY